MLATSSSLSLTLPLVAQSLLDVAPIDWRFAGAEPRRFLNPGELEVLIALVRSVAPTRVAEFGVNEGRTAAGILRNVKGIESYLGIDVEPGYVPKCAVQRNEIPRSPGRHVAADPRFRLLLRKRGSLDVTLAELGEIDVAFIDGDHSCEVVLNDTALAMAAMRPGGIIIWHDYHSLGQVEVSSTLEALAAGGRQIRNVKNTWLAFERR